MHTDDRSKIVDGRLLGTLRGGHAATGLALLAVVEQLGGEELVDLVWHSRVRIICRAPQLR
jgi:hypothetical protein